MAESFLLLSLGCKVNSYEASLLRAPLLAKGLVETNDPSKADYILLNGCAVTARSLQKGRQLVRRLRHLAPKARILVTGCFVSASPGLALELGADAELGTRDRGKALEVLLGSTPPEMTPPFSRLPYEEAGSLSDQRELRAYLKVQDGCSRFCSYCLIPHLRGPSRSRSKVECLREAAYLASLHPEIVVTGIEVAFYGKDLGDGTYRLPDLLLDILEGNPELARLRLSSLEEGAVDDRLLKLFETEGRLASHVHLALQSGSDRVLTKMGRPYSSAIFREKAELLLATRPDMALTTDIIVGFPEEEEGDFEATLRLAAEVGFSKIHVFPYSPRPGTRALKEGLREVDPATKKRRAASLLALSSRLHDRYCEKQYGTKKRAILETLSPSGRYFLGHTSDYLKVRFPAVGHVRGEVVDFVYRSENRAD